MDNLVATNFSHRRGTNRADPSSLYAANGSRKYLNRTERQRVIAAMQKLGSEKALFALTLAWTGARVSEVLALTPASFQIECGIVAIVTLKRRRHCVREVPLPEGVVAAIAQHYQLRHAQADPLARTERLWPWCRQTAWRFITEVMDDVGLVGALASPRGLRHGFGVGTLQAGVPLNLVQRWLGHSKISTTAIYADASGPEEQEFARRFWNQQ